MKNVFEYGSFSRSIDFTNARTMKNYRQAYAGLQSDLKKIEDTGEVEEQIRGQCRVIKRFFDRFLGPGTAQKMFGDEDSAMECMDAVNHLYDLYTQQMVRFNNLTKFRGK